MKDIIYRQEIHKKPFGAVKNNEDILIDILIKKDLNQRYINLVFYRDGDFDNRNYLAMNYEVSDEYYNRYSVKISALDTGLYFYYFDLGIDDKNLHISKMDYTAEISDGIFPWQLTVYDKNFSTPSWIYGGIMYQIFPDRFCRSEKFNPLPAKNEDERIRRDNWNELPMSKVDDENYSAKDFFMGNIQGIIEKKDYLASLNVNTLYLNPIFESAENHRYSTADYFKVDPYLGENSDLENLCKEFKNLGINIILDGVFSHTGSDSIYFNKYNHYDSNGAYNSTESRYFPWFNFIEYPNSYASWWGFDNLPELKKENEDYMDFIFNTEYGVLNFWRKIGIKGWRLDVADELPDVFLDRLRSSVKEKDPEAYILGEVWEDASNKFSYGGRRKYLLGDQLDSVMNYPFRNSIIDFLKTRDSRKFKNSILEIISNYPTPSLDSMMNILSTHDTERILTILGTDKYDMSFEEKKNFRLSEKEYEDAVFLEKFASFLQFTLPGIPSIYYGDEIGMQGFSDPYNRACFDSSSIDQNLFEHYKKLSEFRKKYQKSFSTGFSFFKNHLNEDELSTSDTSYLEEKSDFSDKNLVSYFRNDIFCVVNLGDSPVIIDDIKKGIWVFGNMKPFFTDYGVVIAPKSYTAIKM